MQSTKCSVHRAVPRPIIVEARVPSLRAVAERGIRGEIELWSAASSRVVAGARHRLHPITTLSVVTQFTVSTGKKVDSREACYWSHAWQRVKRSKGVKLDGILESANSCRKTSTMPDSSRAAFGSKGGLAAREGRATYPNPAIKDDCKGGLAARDGRATYLDRAERRLVPPRR
jgi:hypothetical protein